MPETIRMELTQFCDAVSDALGEDLVAVIVYGDALKQSFGNGTSMAVNVLVVLRKIGIGQLDLIMKPYQKAQSRILLAPMILTEENLKASTDVFPIKFLDMRERHLLLYGKDVLKQLKICLDHLRLRCEQELKNMMLRSRVHYLRAMGKPKELKAVVQREFGAYLNCLAGALRLRHETVPADDYKILSAAAKEFDLDLNELIQLRRLSLAGQKFDKAETIQGYSRFMQILKDTAERIDRLEVSQ